MFVLIFLMCIKNIVLYHASLLQVFQHSKFSLFQVKRVSYCEVYRNFRDIEHQLQENILHHCHHY